VFLECERQKMEPSYHEGYPPPQLQQQQPQQQQVQQQQGYPPQQQGYPPPQQQQGYPPGGYILPQLQGYPLEQQLLLQQQQLQLQQQQLQLQSQSQQIGGYGYPEVKVPTISHLSLSELKEEVEGEKIRLEILQKQFEIEKTSRSWAEKENQILEQLILQLEKENVQFENLKKDQLLLQKELDRVNFLLLNPEPVREEELGDSSDDEKFSLYDQGLLSVDEFPPQKQRIVSIFENETRKIIKLVTEDPKSKISLGGDLFGSWDRFGNPTIHMVTGPSPQSIKVNGKFLQDGGYTQSVSKELEIYGLRHIGVWFYHSNNRKKIKKEEDFVTTQYLLKEEKSVVIAFATLSSSNVELSFSLVGSLNPLVVEKMSVSLLPAYSWIASFPNVQKCSVTLEMSEE